MKCLDTYALVEIANGNPNFTNYFREDFVLTNETLAEFFWVLLRDDGDQTANYWYKKLVSYSVAVPVSILIRAMSFRYAHKKQNLSFFDCVGYLFALENNTPFVTGDRQFSSFENVEFIK